MKFFTYVIFIVICFGARMGNAESELLKAREGFKTKFVRELSDETELSASPDPTFSIVRYPTKLGKMGAYLSEPQDTKKKHPAIIWLTGGIPPGDIGAWIWESRRLSNDQSALAYHDAGMVMMYPSFRGLCGNPGQQESFLGEVDDVLAALKYLQSVPYVDSSRIYLGGHSTGGTLALLVAEATSEFKAIFAFGAVASPSSYGQESATYEIKDKKETKLRSPIEYLEAITSPTFLIEGEDGGNSSDLNAIAKASANKHLKCISIKGATHFDLLYPLNQFIAEDVMKGGPNNLSQTLLRKIYDDFWTAQYEAADLESLAGERGAGTDITKIQRVSYYFWADFKNPLETMASKVDNKIYVQRTITAEQTSAGEKYYLLVLKREVKLNDLAAVFQASQNAREMADLYDTNHSGWSVEGDE